MARRSGGTHKGVEEKRRSLPIYEHYTLSPGKTKSHHPEAKCNHCHKEFVCGSKQRLIRHLRKCNNISNPELIIAETLNTLARNSATGQLNHSILEASNLLPSQIQQHHHHHTQQQQNQIISQSQQIHSSPTSSTITTATNNIINGNNNNNNISNHNNSGSSSNDTGLIASSSNGSSQQNHLVNTISIPIKRPQRRGRKPTNQTLASSSPTIHVTTGLDGKTHFTPASQLPPNVTVGAPITIGQVHGSPRPLGFTYHPNNVSTTSGVVTSGTLNASLPTNPVSGHLACATTNHHHTTVYKLNSEPIDKAYLKLVLTRNLPLSLCDTKEFQLWIKTFANDYKPPNSINLIAHNMKNEAQAAKQRISNILVKAFKKTINLELHSWPDDNLRGHLWYALIANIDLKRFLISVKDVKQQNSININLNNSVSSTTTLATNDNTDATSLQQQQQRSSTTTTDTNELMTTPAVKILSDFIDECVKRVGSDRINSLVYSDVDELSEKASQSLYANHPSIVTYQCWWDFTNLLCSDIINQNRTFEDVLRKSNLLINFVNKRPTISQNLEKFNPFIGLGSNVIAKKNDHRWYSHLVCYLLKFIRNNNEAIIRALEAISTQSQHRLSSDNNNNSSSGTSMNTQSVIQQQHTSTQQQHSQQFLSCHEDSQFIEIESIVMSSDYWSNLNSVLVYLKPIHDIVALTSTISNQSNNNNINGTLITPAASPIIANSMSLSIYMSWFLDYGKTLINSWRESPDNYKYQLIKKYFDRFSSTISRFKLLLAAYLLNPKYRCAYMTQKAKDTAIEEILNIASEFMPEESDGHTIFDQWKLYLVREEPYDVIYEESRTTPLEWWMSLPCAESIRRVALRILRLKSFASPKPETLFSQLYFYEDETNSILNGTTFEDIAVLRYFYDFEDKIGQTLQSTSHNYHHHTNSANNSSSHHSFTSINGYLDRTQVGQLHNNHSNQSNYSTKYLPSGALNNSSSNNNNNGSSDNNNSSEVNGQDIGDTTTLSSINDNVNRQGYNDSTFSDVVVDSYLNHNQQHLQSHQHHLTMDSQSNNIEVIANLSIEDLPGYKLFTQYIDYNLMGVQIVEEPIEKKKRKWTAQEILSKCQSNHQNNNNNNVNSK